MNKRIENLKSLFDQFQIDHLIIEDTTDVFYLTGMKFSRARLVVSRSEELLFLDGRYIDSAKEKFPCEKLSDKKLKEYLEKTGGKLGFNSLKINFHDYEKLAKVVGKVVTLTPLENPVKDLRMVKDEAEIDLLRKSAKLNYQTFEYIQSELKEGITEKELAMLIEIYFRKNGAEKIAFDPIVCFSENGAFPHHHPSERKLKVGDSILFDMGCVLNDYHSDMTRVIFFKETNKEIEKLLNLTKQAQKMAVDSVKPGITVGSLDKMVCEFFESHGMADLIKHRLGHGIGLEIHEPPSLSFEGQDKDTILKPHMVFTVEPGLYQVGLGGVRYEDTICVTQNGVENFYPS